jgi:hypothetical protein
MLITPSKRVIYKCFSAIVPEQFFFCQSKMARFEQRRKNTFSDVEYGIHEKGFF